MALTKTERRALERLRRYVALERASLTPPDRAQERGYGDAFRSGGKDLEPPVRPLAGEDANLDYRGDAWTNDVAASLKVYTESWVLPIIDALLDQRSPKGNRSFTAEWYLKELRS